MRLRQDGLGLASIPSPSSGGFGVGPLEVHVYGLMYAIGVALAIYITRRLLGVALLALSSAC